MAGDVSAGTANADWTPVARLLRPQGRHGEILADPLTNLLEVFKEGCLLRMTAENGSSAEHATVNALWHPQGRNAGRIVLKLSGVDTISAAEVLAGRTLLMETAKLPALEMDTFFVKDLVGCDLWDDDQFVGRIIDLQFPIAADGRTRIPDAADLLVIEPKQETAEDEPILVPFVKAWLEGVDIAEKQVRMHLPPGLFEEKR